MKTSDSQQAAEQSMRFNLRIIHVFAPGENENPRAEVSLAPDKMLRGLAGRREVWLAKDSVTQQPRIAKAFLPGRKQRREYKREVYGLVQLARREIPGPKLLFTAEDSAGRLWVVTEFIENSMTLDDVFFGKHDAEQRFRAMERFVHTLLLHWKRGVNQTDAHYKNFLWDGAEIHTIDVGLIHFRKTISFQARTKLLSVLCHHFSDDMRNIFLRAFEQAPRDKESQAILAYLKGRDFPAKLEAQRRKSVFRLWRKCQRNCTGFQRLKFRSTQLIVARNEDPDLVETLLRRADSLMGQGERLKNGNTCTVQKVTVGGRSLVVKRYNSKPWHYRLRHAFSTSRALRSWANSHVLRSLGIATAAPVAAVEVRKFGLLSRAYYVMEYVEGRSLHASLDNESPAPKCLARAVDSTARIFKTLRTHYLVHGDTKATNFILSEAAVHVIDVDAVQIHRPSRRFEKRFERDWLRFLSNWNERQEIRNAFNKALPKA